VLSVIRNCPAVVYSVHLPSVHHPSQYFMPLVFYMYFLIIKIGMSNKSSRLFI
jgi:hypothetical protein